jgi:hypothetical protein
MRDFFSDAEYQSHPLRILKDFIRQEEAYEKAKQYDKMRFVGYVLEIGFDEVTIITSDPFKLAVGGIPRGSFLIMAPDSLDGLPPHFTLLRVTATAPTPLSQEVQQTYFELHKKSMPELDLWTKSELQWGALATKVLGMYYPNPEVKDRIAFAGDVNNIVSGHRYKIYAPDTKLLNLIVNGTVRQESQFKLGGLRLTESQLLLPEQPPLDVPVQVSTRDFRGFRTAMFGKTRLGKSNVVKLIAKSLIETTAEDKSVGQLIFDINGEYANDNPQDGSLSLRSAFPGRCVVYALTERPLTPSKPLRLNFFEQPDACMSVLSGLLNQSPNTSQYIRSFASVTLPTLEEVEGAPVNDKLRMIRKIQYYWAILQKAGYQANEAKLRALQLRAGKAANFNPGFSAKLREAAYRHANQQVPSAPNSLAELVRELEVVNKFRRDESDSELLVSGSNNALFDADDMALLEFFSPSYGNGPVVIRPYREYHSPAAGDFIGEILQELDTGKTVILDLGNATDQIRQYFSDMLSKAVFNHQEKKFTGNKLGDHFVQLYFEEAHNLFPRDSKDVTDVYSRFAKEGAKFHIGMVYSTQSPSTVNRDLLAQTENFFVAHMSSQDEANVLAKLQVAFDGLQRDILSTRTPGYMRMLTFSHRFVVPVQANKFEATTGSNNGR